MSQQLQKYGHQVARLTIFDAIAPHLFELSEVAHVIERMLGTPLDVSYEILQKLDSEGQLNYILERLKKASFLPPFANQTHIRSFIDVYKANCQMDYKPKNIKPTRIVFFQASEFIGELMGGHDELVEAEPTWGWNQYADGPVDIHVVPGDHHTMMSQPHVQVLAEKLKVCFEQSLMI
jgi:thioesterase domain-containing protein